VRVKHLGGLGASFLNDAAGPNQEFVTQSFSVSGAYNFHLSRYGNNILSMGMQAGLTQQRINFDALEWSSQYNPISGYDDTRSGETANVNSQILNPLITVGVMWYYTTRGRMSTRNASVFSGVSVANLVRPPGFVEDTKGTASILYKLHGGFVTMRKLKYEISPNYLIQYQNSSFQVNVGTYFSYFLQPPRLHHSKTKKVTVGTWYRLQDAFIFSTGFSNTTWNFGFSYDTNVSSMGRNLGIANAYEVSLAYKIIVNKGFKRFSSPLI
jgi:type IX secretion system PorP/SprF family membrane protein